MTYFCKKIQKNPKKPHQNFSIQSIEIIIEKMPWPKNNDVSWMASTIVLKMGR